MQCGRGERDARISGKVDSARCGNIEFDPIQLRVRQHASSTTSHLILEIRHSSLYAPRDFDISPYFEVVKPTIVQGFDYKRMSWSDLVQGEAAPPRL